MLYSETCKTGHLQVDETTVKVMGTFNKLVWSVPRQDVTYIALKKGAMMTDLTIYTAYNHFPANFMAGQKAEKFLAFFPNVPVGPELQGGMQPQGAVQPVPQTTYAPQPLPQGQWQPGQDQMGVSQSAPTPQASSASQPLSEQGQMSPMPSMPGQASQYPQQPLSGQYQSGQPPFYPPGSGMMPSKPPRKKLGRRTWVIVGVVVLIVVIIIAVNSGTKGTGNTTTANTSTQPASQSTVQQTTANAPTAVPTKAPTPKPTFASFGDGTFQVGKDIKPGTYRTRVGSPGCYYEKLSGFGGTVGDIIANNNTDYPAIVTIAPTDKGFDSQGCGTWTEDLSQITTSKTTFSDGIYIIGTDITPGTYKNTGATGCYYARLSGFGGTIDNIIANNNVDTATIVTIAPTDKGFESNGCGTWTKQ
ncbi:MAG TPA: hypothetical protein VNG51_27865 [Ktedonobacteraceae bacterium]|nr:hypothetical protein [Ktedonobacteraceae bacterium]